MLFRSTGNLDSCHWNLLTPHAPARLIQPLRTSAAHVQGDASVGLHRRPKHGLRSPPSSACNGTDPNHLVVLCDGAVENVRFTQEVGGGAGKYLRAKHYDLVGARRRRCFPKED